MTSYSLHDKFNNLTNNESVFPDNLCDWLFACRIISAYINERFTLPGVLYRYVTILCELGAKKI